MAENLFLVFQELVEGKLPPDRVGFVRRRIWYKIGTGWAIMPRRHAVNQFRVRFGDLHHRWVRRNSYMRAA
jgi:hypothetical protein